MFVASGQGQIEDQLVQPPLLGDVRQAQLAQLSTEGRAQHTGKTLEQQFPAGGTAETVQRTPLPKHPVELGPGLGLALGVTLFMSERGEVQVLEQLVQEGARVGPGGELRQGDLALGDLPGGQRVPQLTLDRGIEPGALQGLDGHILIVVLGGRGSLADPRQAGGRLFDGLVFLVAPRLGDAGVAGPLPGVIEVLGMAVGVAALEQPRLERAGGETLRGTRLPVKRLGDRLTATEVNELAVGLG